MDDDLYVARFKSTPGRYLVWGCRGCWYDGVRILDRRQEKYGNRPDPETGLYLDEARVSLYGGANLTSLKPFERPNRA